MVTTVAEKRGDKIDREEAAAEKRIEIACV